MSYARANAWSTLGEGLQRNMGGALLQALADQRERERQAAETAHRDRMFGLQEKQLEQADRHFDVGQRNAMTREGFVWDDEPASPVQGAPAPPQTPDLFAGRGIGMAGESVPHSQSGVGPALLAAIRPPQVEANAAERPGGWRYDAERDPSEVRAGRQREWQGEESGLQRALVASEGKAGRDNAIALEMLRQRGDREMWGLRLGAGGRSDRPFDYVTYVSERLAEIAKDPVLNLMPDKRQEAEARVYADADALMQFHGQLPGALTAAGVVPGVGAPPAVQPGAPQQQSGASASYFRAGPANPLTDSAFGTPTQKPQWGDQRLRDWQRAYDFAKQQGDDALMKRLEAVRP